MDDEEETADEDSPDIKPNIKQEIKSEIMDLEQKVEVTLPITETEIKPELLKVKSELLEDEIAENPVENVAPDPQHMGDNLIPGEAEIKKKEKDPSKANFPGPPRSTCRARSRDPRRCQKHFREMIGKHEIKNEELEKKEGDLRQRLEMIECSMPAVMVWNIWRMAQGAPVPSIRRVVEKQFQGFASGSMPCPSTPSQHYDCRVREVEAERKQAQRRADEARALWAEKELALEEQKRKLEEARKTQALHKERIEKLTAEVQEMRKAREEEKAKDSCQTGECGEIRCKQMWLGDVASTTSVKSTDLECLARLQDLAEAELCMKRHITELERREETYMRTLQQADELWSRMESDAASTMSGLQEQLDLKTSANQQLADKVCSLEDAMEKMNKKLANCRNELGKFVGIEHVDAIIGSDDDYAAVADKDTDAGAKMTDKDTLARAAMLDKDTMAGRAKMADKDTMAEMLDELSSVFSDEDYEPCPEGICEGSEFYSDSEGEPCGPDFACNDEVFSPTGMEDDDPGKTQPGADDKTGSKDPEVEKEKEPGEPLVEKSIRSHLQVEKDLLPQEILTTPLERDETTRADLNLELYEGYEMATENLPVPDKIPLVESEKATETEALKAGALIVIGKLSSEKIIEVGESVKQRGETEVTGIDAAEIDDVDQEQKQLSDSVKVDGREKKHDDQEGEEDDKLEAEDADKEKTEDQEKLSDVLHLQDAVIDDARKREQDVEKETVSQGKGLAAEDAEKKRTEDQEKLSDVLHLQDAVIDDARKREQDVGKETVSQGKELEAEDAEKERTEDQEKLSEKGEEHKDVGKEILSETTEEEEEGKEISELEKEISATKVAKDSEATPKDLVPVPEEKEISKISREKLAKKISDDNSECLCQPEEAPIKKARVEKELPKVFSEDKIEEQEETVCVCKGEGVSRGESKPRPKLIIIRRTVCRRPDQSSSNLQQEESANKVKKTKLSYIKVKDEYMGTVVSVGLQTERKVRKERSPLRRMRDAQIVGSDSTMNSSCILTDESRQRKEKVPKKYKGPSESESRCFVCKRVISSKDAVHVSSDVQAAFAQKLAGPKSEISMVCCSCKLQQDSKSKEKIRPHKQPKKSSNKNSSCPLSPEIVKEVKVGVCKKLCSSQDKKDQSCLAKLIRSNIDYRRQKSDSETDVKHTKRSKKPELNPESDNLGFSQTESSSCVCVPEKTSSVRDGKSISRKKQFKVEENRICHCDDSD